MFDQSRTEIAATEPKGLFGQTGLKVFLRQAVTGVHDKDLDT